MVGIVAKHAFLTKVGFDVPSGVAGMACSQQQKPATTTANSDAYGSKNGQECAAKGAERPENEND